METGNDGPPNLGDRVDELMYRWDELRRRPVVVAGALVVAMLLVLAALGIRRVDGTRPVDDRIPQVALEATSPPTTLPLPLLVHVVGAVHAPGVYELPAGSRVLDAVHAAGGATADGQPGRLNLAASLADGVQIRVPVDGEPVLDLTRSDALQGPLDLNTATAAELEALPGIGPATAAAIVAHRQAIGRFARVEDLLEVKGIGEAKLAAIADLVVVR